jgi:hypothetical protein
MVRINSSRPRPAAFGPDAWAVLDWTKPSNHLDSIGLPEMNGHREYFKGGN